MSRAENFIVEGKCFYPLDDFKKYSILKNLIKEFMVIKNYVSADDFYVFDTNKFLTMSFSKNLNIPKTSLLKSIKKNVGFLHEDEIFQEKYFISLDLTRDDLPFKVIFYIIPTKLKDNNGFFIQIRSEPAILFKMRQLNYRPVYDEFIYSNIIDTNKQFINEIMFALTGGNIIEKPKAISEFILTPFIDRLNNLRFDKTAQLFKQGNLKLERGDIEDGLTDLRGALEEFIEEIVKKINVESAGNIRNNLDILKKHGYIDEHLHSIIQYTLYDWVYKHISNTSVHKREKLNIIDARLLFSVSELIMNCLIEKAVFRR